MKGVKPEERDSRFPSNETVWRTAMAVAVLSGLFSLVVSVLLIANYVQIRAAAPLDDPELLKLRAQLAAAPTADENLVQQIRLLDLLARKAFFTSQDHLKMGGYLLLGGVIVLLIALRTAAKYRSRVPIPEGEPPATAYWGSRARAKELIALSGLLLVIAALYAAYFTRLDIPVSPGTPISRSASKEQAPSYPDWETMLQQWPSFRGPGGYGVANYTTAPTDWDVGTGKNIKWKTEVPLPGANSPVVWNNRVFLSGATEEIREVYCFDTETGELLWRRALGKLPGTPAEVPKVTEDTGFAAPTLVAHGDRVFAIFANGDLACFDVEGNLVWSKSLGLPDNHYGHSSSLLAYMNVLYIQYDQKKNGKLFAFDIANGNEVWTVDRKKISWASPVCVPTRFGFQLVLNSESDVDAYDPLTGAPLWSLKCLDGEVAPSPAYGGEMFFVANDNATATAIRFDPAADTPKPDIAWQWDEALPDVCSPVGTDTHFYICTSRGEIVCLDIKTGKQAWLQEYDEGFYASPILVGDRIYAIDKKGTAYVFKTGPTFELIASPKFNEEVYATPAFMDGRIYARAGKNLICIANENKPGN